MGKLRDSGGVAVLSFYKFVDLDGLAESKGFSAFVLRERTG